MSPKFPHPWRTHSKPSRAASSWAVFYATDQHTLQRRHNECDSVSDHQPHDCLLNRLFGRGSKKTSKLRVTGLCAGNSPGTGEFPAQIASNAENVSIGWRHHVRGRRSMKSWQRTSILWITPVYLGNARSGAFRLDYCHEVYAICRYIDQAGNYNVHRNITSVPLYLQLT